MFSLLLRINIVSTIRYDKKLTVLEFDQIDTASSLTIFTFQVHPRLMLGLVHLCEHRFKHSFHDMLNLFSDCGSESKATIHYLLHYPIDESEIMHPYEKN